MEFLFDDDKSITEIARSILGRMDVESLSHKTKTRRKTAAKKSTRSTSASKSAKKRVKTIITSTTRAQRLRLLHSKQKEKRKIERMIEDQQKKNEEIALQIAKRNRVRSASTRRPASARQPTASSLARSKSVIQDKVIRRRGAIIDTETRMKRRASVANYKPTVPKSPLLRIDDRMGRRQSMHAQLKNIKTKIKNKKASQTARKTKPIAPKLSTEKRAQLRAAYGPKLSPLKKKRRKTKRKGVSFQSTLMRDTKSTLQKKVRPKSAPSNAVVGKARKATRLLKAKQEERHTASILIPKSESIEMERSPFQSPRLVVDPILSHADVYMHFDATKIHSPPQVNSVSSEELMEANIIEPYRIQRRSSLDLVVETTTPTFSSDGIVCPPPSAQGETDFEADLKRADELFEALSASVTEETTEDTSETLNSTTKRALVRLEDQMRELDRMFLSS